MAEKFTTDKIISALKATNGLVYLAARQVGCTPKTIYTRAKSSAAVRQAIEDSRGELIDLSELKLRAAVLNGEPWAVALVLKTLGKDRGYFERQETVTKGETLEVVTRVVRRDADHG
jgi:hypothetical protein